MPGPTRSPPVGPPVGSCQKLEAAAEMKARPAVLLICLTVRSQASGTPLRFQIPFQTSHPQGAKTRQHGVAFALVSSAGPGGRRGKHHAPGTGQRPLSAAGYHSGGLSLTLRLHDLLPLLLFCFFYQKLGSLGLLLSCVGRKWGVVSQM